MYKVIVFILNGRNFTFSGLQFGHHPANRLEMSRGCDINVSPALHSCPINFLAYPVFEIGEKRLKTKPELSFTRTGGIGNNES